MRSALHASLCWLISTIFLFSGAIKLTDVPRFEHGLSAFPFLPHSSLPLWAWLIPLLELACGAAMLWPQTRRSALTFALVLISSFTLVMLWVFFSDRQIACSCFGPLLANLSPGWAVLRNVVLTTVIFWLRRNSDRQGKLF